LSQRVKVAFASCLRDHVPAFLDRFSEIDPRSELWVVSEFQPPRGRWIPYRIDRSAGENLTALRAALGGRAIQFVALSLQPNSPYGAMRRMALRVAPLRTLLYNENLDHFTLRPPSWPGVLRYLAWKTREHIAWQTHPGGNLYTFLWRLKHPREFRRPLAYLAAKKAGKIAADRKATLPHLASPRLGTALPAGISVVIPTRNGRDLLAVLLPVLRDMLKGRTAEIIVVDNGSTDGTAEFVATDHPAVRCQVHPAPLSFARAVNRGIEMARYSQVLLLNNDMRPHDGFFQPLVDAFGAVPDLFCATAQIFFPEGRRREETGKAVFPTRPQQHAFPVECAAPLEGEDGSYVFYGSGGCSLYDTAKLRALGGFSEIFEPSYVEDLDIGFRAWQRGWPTIFVARSRVTHHHRATTARYFTADQLEHMVERNYLRFLVRSVGDPEIFTRLWRYAVDRLNWKAAIEHHAPSLKALLEAKDAVRFVESTPAINEERIFAIGSGDVAVFPGRAVRDPATPIVLVATSYIPFPLSHGGAVRMYNLMRRAAPDFGQVLITFVDELHTPADELLDICVEIVQVRRVGSHVKPDRGRPEVVEEFDTPAFRAALDQTARKWKPAIAQLEFTQMAMYAPDCAPAKTVMVEHDVTIDLYQQLLENSEDWELRRQLDRWRDFEKNAWANTDCVVVMSDKDRATVVNARKVVTLANGVDIERFKPSAVELESNRLLFVGSFAHLPNLLAIDFFLREVWPLLASRHPHLNIIAGAKHGFHYERFRDRLGFSLDTPGVTIDGFVADVRPAYRQSAVVIAPLLASAGTNIKIMEAMAMGKAIVATTGGVNGLDLTSGVEAIVENDPVRMAAAISALLDDPQRRRELGRKARLAAEERFSWDVIARTQREMYLDLLRS
jgi:GT2 family glycosyltransferase/glycosyltransferase involved in cell wall biosynthesis